MVHQHRAYTTFTSRGNRIQCPPSIVLPPCLFILILFGNKSRLVSYRRPPVVPNPVAWPIYSQNEKDESESLSICAYHHANGLRSINKCVLGLRKVLPSAHASDTTAVILGKAVEHIARLEADIDSRLPGRRGSVDDQSVTFKDASYRNPSKEKEESTGMTEPKECGIKMEREGTDETEWRQLS